MNRSIRMLLVAALAAGVTLIAGCGDEEAATNLTVERLPDVQPNLPEVPTLPPPPHPVTYSDGSYSIYGLRRRMRNTMDTDVEVTGYIVDVYEPPECEEEPCPTPKAPHMWMADTPDETDEGKKLMVVGYAENQEQIEEAIADAERGKEQEADPELGIIPIPTDFAPGNKIKVQGRFTRVSGAGFNTSEGLIDYRGHETLEAVESDDS